MTWKEMYEQIARELEDATSAGVGAANIWSVADLKHYLNQANKQIINQLNTSVNWMLDVDNTITTVASTQSYDLPADFGHIARVWINQQYSLRKMHYRRLGTDSTSTGQPTRYLVEGAYYKDGATPTIYYRKMKLWPIPDAVYTIYYDYFMRTPTMDTDTDVSPVPEGYHMAVVYRAAAMACVRKGMMERRQALMEEYDDQMAQMIMAISMGEIMYDRPDFVDVFGDGAGDASIYEYDY
jgi:hypothetical protein